MGSLASCVVDAERLIITMNIFLEIWSRNDPCSDLKLEWFDLILSLLTIKLI